MDFVDFIDLIPNATENERDALREIAEKILTYQKANEKRKPEVIDYKEHFQKMENGELRRILKICIAIRLMTESQFCPEGCPNSMDILGFFSSWVQIHKDELNRLLKDETARIVNKYESYYYIGMGQLRRLCFFLSSDDCSNKIIDEISLQKLDKEQMAIVFLVFDILNWMEPKVEKTVESSLETCDISKPILKTAADLELWKSVSEEQNVKTRVTTKNFQEEKERMKQKALEQQKVRTLSEIPSTQLPENVTNEPHISLQVVAAENENLKKTFREQQELFEKDVTIAKTENEKTEIRMIEEKIKHDQKLDLDFQKVLKRQKEEHEEEYRKAQKEIEEYEKETQRILKEREKVHNAFISAFLACARKAQIFEEKEKEWADWLVFLKDSIRNVKTRYELFERIMRNILKTGKNYDGILRKELSALHKTVISSYEVLFRACDTVKKLDSKFPEAVFLRILHEKLVKVANDLCHFLEEIDNSSVGFSFLY